MKLKIPPAIQFLIFAVAMFIITKLTGKNFSFALQNVVVLLLFILGTIIGLFSVLSFKKAHTSIDPMHPSKATKLIISGLYQYTRNPMYLGLVIIQTALFFGFGNYYNIIILFIYGWYLTNYQIKPEEEALKEIFGDVYTQYCEKVRRWV
ncbi:isoprenylcysteine carboxylmethyltransferase family protein [Aureibaculum sp. A20]|uniref:Isoprenylcysteine carboxylmethyltransferase family protein n=1 Tax=Aureibaculum flavum TaxID=2795986 RepID=A0ABS0WT63_9FLAO|nr:isoprenylcysteine carboxylmethyltransferase family protein [Aureibaculum flavum]MBJ2175153.1 isoprenylcysteine carboxylmethyltransferase family protein [Aureibaculum flavum]